MINEMTIAVLNHPTTEGDEPDEGEAKTQEQSFNACFIVEPHTFRRTFCLWSLRAEVNVYVLQRLMGHSDIQVLRPYLAVAHADLKAAQQHGALPTLLQQAA